ncbi:MAG TPA: ABC transporter ATP-binding protein [Acidimicrobiales bacterium]|nr:ABC transporter ATP-binding protein [Acidimicrobiales bacterium]
MSANSVECAGVTKAFGPVRALNGVDLAVPTGSVTALLGPSGCGKTTLLRVVAGFERPDDGSVSVGGRTVAGPGIHLPPERRRVGIVPQEHALFPHLTVAGNVGYGLSRGPARATRVEEVLALAGLPGLGDRMPHELSGGQQQRVALARALAPGPSVVLLDEPFGSLDAALRVELRAEIAAVLRASGATAVLVTHDQDEALSMADLVAVMRDGRVVQLGPPDEVYQRPADLWVAGFVGRANVLAGEMVGPGKVSSALGILEAVGGPASGPVRLAVRPEQVRVAADPAGEGRVENRQYFGHDALVAVVLGDGTHLLARTPSGAALPVGSAVAVACDGPVAAFSG